MLKKKRGYLRSCTGSPLLLLSFILRRGADVSRARCLARSYPAWVSSTAAGVLGVLAAGGSVPSAGAARSADREAVIRIAPEQL